MINRRTLNDVINPGYNPNQNAAQAPNFQNQQNVFVLNDSQSSPNDTRSLPELLAENERLKLAIATWKDKKPVFQEELINQAGMSEEVNKRIAFNDEKLRDLNEQVRQQEEVMKAYQLKFVEFQDNLNKLMKLDKDIHSKLVNPEHSNTL